AGTIETSGPHATGMFVQSAGGGGGLGGDAYTAGVSLLGLSVGGSGGAGGRGGAVTVANHGTIALASDVATGIHAQSVGGGGGVGGSAFSGTGSPKLNVSISVGGSGGAGGAGDEVIVTNTGAVSVAGDDSRAIFAQSVGGGGGRAGSASSYAVS